MKLCCALLFYPLIAIVNSTGGTLALLPVNDIHAMNTIGQAMKGFISDSMWALHIGLGRIELADSSLGWDHGFRWIAPDNTYPFPSKSDTSYTLPWAPGEPNGDGGPGNMQDAEIYFYNTGEILLNDAYGRTLYFMCQLDSGHLTGQPIIVNAFPFGGGLMAPASIILHTVTFTKGVDRIDAIDFCSEKCAALLMCKSFNMNLRTGECQLQSLLSRELTAEKVNAPGFEWYDVKRV